MQEGEVLAGIDSILHTRTFYPIVGIDAYLPARPTLVHVQVYMHAHVYAYMCML